MKSRLHAKRISMLLLLMSSISILTAGQHDTSPLQRSGQKLVIDLEAFEIPALMLMMADEQELTLSTHFIRCYQDVVSGAHDLLLDDVLRLLPELLAYLNRMETNLGIKAPRADDPGANDAIVGKSCCDLTPIFALLGAIKKRFIALQELICSKFEQTWTILEQIDQDIINTQTILCEKFFETWTILQNISVDIDGVFTVLNDIDQDIIDTRTILCEKFLETWTILENIDQDVIDTQTILCEKFFETWTILQNIDTEITGVFTAISNVDQDVIDTRTILCEKFLETWTILDVLSCGAETPITAPIVITTPGSYCLANDIVGTVTIDADRVLLNLHGHRILGSGNKIEIMNHTDVTIRDGVIEGLSGIGAEVIACTNITIEGVDFINNATGVFVISTTGFHLDDATFREHTGSAIRLEDTNNSSITRTSATFNAVGEVVALFGCSNINLAEVQLNNNSGIADNLTGIQLTAVYNCTINNVSINNNVHISGGFSPKFIGIDLLDTNSDITIINTHINNNSGPGIFGINVGETSKLVCQNCTINDNRTDGVLDAVRIVANNARDCIFQECMISENFGESNCIGFLLSSARKVLIDACLIYNNNSGVSGPCAGISFTLTINCCVRNCLIKENMSLNAAFGISVSGTTNLIEKNVVKDNTGSLFSTGISVAAAADNVFFNNEVQGHGVGGVNNFIGVPGPIVTFNPTTGLFGTPPTPFDNISIILP